MTGQAGFALRGRNPDVLTCIANLSSDEVFTPPELANRMLDTLAEAWAADNTGADIWADKTVKFLDPCTKSGVFLREITKRLTNGLADEIPDLQKRVDHILTRQVFGIGITHLTSLLARRSLYCSKYAKGEHSIAKSFATDDGNVWFRRLEHSWVAGRCKYCGAGQSVFDRGADFETHAYAFIHTDEVKTWTSQIIGGEKMQFDVIIGNPPYQLASDGGTRDIPIYNKFVEQARNLSPRFLVMVIPSRWMTSGLGMTEFRRSILEDRRIRSLVDYPVAREVFPGVEIKGGVCFFLWNREAEGECAVTTVRGKEVIGPVSRRLDEYDVLIRDSRALKILEKVIAHGEPSLTKMLSARTAFGLVSNFQGYSEKKRAGDVRYYAASPKGRITAWVKRTEATTNHAAIDRWKAMVPKAGSDGGQKLPDVVLGQPWIAEPPAICTQSFLFVCTDSREEAESVASYYRTRFLRFLVSLRKITQDTTRESYLWVPQQSWDRIWTDRELFAKYGITPTEQAYIEAHVRELSPDNGSNE